MIRRTLVPIGLVIWCCGMGWALSWTLTHLWPALWYLWAVLVGLSGIAGFRVADTYARTYRLRSLYRDIWRRDWGTDPQV